MSVVTLAACRADWFRLYSCFISPRGFLPLPAGISLILHCVKEIMSHFRWLSHFQGLVHIDMFKETAPHFVCCLARPDNQTETHFIIIQSDIVFRLVINRTVGGSSPGSLSTCQSVLEQNTEPEIIPDRRKIFVAFVFVRWMYSSQEQWWKKYSDHLLE